MCGAKTHAIARESNEHERWGHWTLIADYLVSSWFLFSWGSRSLGLFLQLCWVLFMLISANKIYCMWFFPFRTCRWAGFVYLDSWGGCLNKYPYQPGVGGYTSNSLGCTDIWWQFLYLYSIWNVFHSKVGQLILYLDYACLCILGCSTLFSGLCMVAVLFPLSCFWPSEEKV